MRFPAVTPPTLWPSTWCWPCCSPAGCAGGRPGSTCCSGRLPSLCWWALAGFTSACTTSPTCSRATPAGHFGQRSPSRPQPSSSGPGEEASMTSKTPKGMLRWHRPPARARDGGRETANPTQREGNVLAERRNPQQMSQAEIQEELSSLEEELEELAHERQLTLGGTGVHIGAKEVERLRAEFERDERRVLNRIEELRSAL